MNRLSYAISVGPSAYVCARAAIAAAGFLALLAACEPDVRIIHGESNCKVKGDALFISVGFKIQHHLPSRCPIFFNGPVWDYGGQTFLYEATQKIADNGTVPANTLVYLDIYAPDRHLFARSHPLEDWGDSLRADVTGSYRAGSVDPGCTGCGLEDYAIQQVIVPRRGLAKADVLLPYRQAFLTHVDGPGSVGYGQHFTLTASVTENARQPVTFEWFVEGESAGPPAQNATFSAWGQNEGAHQTYEVLVTDAEGGKVRSGPYRVWVSYPEGSGCDPTAIQCPE